MAYTKEELTKLGAIDLREARKKIVDISLFDYVDSVKLSDDTKRVRDFTMQLYQEYLEHLKEFSKKDRLTILKTFRDKEVIDNQTTEEENYELLREYVETKHTIAINYLLRKIITDECMLDDYIFKKTHEILMRGTSLDGCEDVIKYRDSNEICVGRISNGEKIIRYFPISYDEIPKAKKLLFDYCNIKTYSLDDELNKIFIIHGLIGALQFFKDGNTRLARTIEHIELYGATCDYLDNSFELPVVYCSNSYHAFRSEYRDILAKIAVNHKNEEWDEWIRFNYNQLKGQILMNDDRLDELERKRRRLW